ncbi:PucR family transcriptional regulator [Actinomycetospora chiangmaiensis]|uniref:PucR family transcriptional regulator n=1 Tax=Actinomycetospora chiangmaiensis TaxID=402650 RepID=UPI000361785D|nr:helix-turn-helix domain-containing protein [Actinomycetospora chiangmaiensis]
MTGHNEPSSGAPHRPVAAWLRAEKDAMCDALVHGHRTVNPQYRTLPVEQLEGDVRAITNLNLDVVIASLEGDEEVRRAAEPRLRESAARRAEEGVALGAALRAYQLSARWLLDAAVEAGVVEVGTAPWHGVLDAMLDHLSWVTPVVTAGYLEAADGDRAHDARGRQAALSALLAGASAATAARVGELRLPPRVVVLAVVLAPHPDALAGDEVDGTVVERRKVRRVRGELERQFPGDVLVSLSADSGIVVLPLAAEDLPDGPDVPEPVLRRLRHLTRELVVVAGAELRVAAVTGRTDDVRGAAELAREVLRVAGIAGPAEPVVQLRDVAVAYQLTRPGPALDALASRLDRLDGHPELENTLHSWLRHDCARRATAADLHVHPNTVDHRVRRIAEMIGLDLGRPGDLLTARAALLARAARSPAVHHPVR